MKLKTQYNFSWHNQWDIIDSAVDPEWFVKFLDATRLRQLEIINKDPSRYYSFLNLKPNLHILDLGCGTGIMLHPLAGLVGENGRVVGVDISDFMVREARKRAEVTDLPLEFYKGTVYNLDFPDNSFDRATSSTLFQHLKRPDEALREITRVLKPGGIISIWEQDWETLMIASSYDEISRKILDYFCSSLKNGTIAKHLPKLFADEGLINVFSTPKTINLSYNEFMNSNFGFHQTIRLCVEDEIITDEEIELWLKDLAYRASQGKFFLAFTAYRVIGRKK